MTRSLLRVYSETHEHPRSGTPQTLQHPAGWALKALPPLSLYVHIPWCLKKCPYCDFNSHTQTQQSDESGYVDALILDLEQALPLIWNRPIFSIFFGGGTPSLLAPESVEHLLNAFRARLRWKNPIEITLEANPGTVETTKFLGYRAAGVNRLSIGIQSFEDRHLQALGRAHCAAEARHAVEVAATIFENVNLDLMYALPGQTLAEAVADVQTALSYSVKHLSCYQLTLEPHTRFHRAPPPDLPEHDICANMQLAVEQQLQQAHYIHYETSAFASPDRESQHNLNYWTFGDYLGIGAGAHSKLSFSDQILRISRYRQPAQYMRQTQSGSAVQHQEAIAETALPLEFMMNALRLTQGLPISLFTERSGLPLSAIEAQRTAAEAAGLLLKDPLILAPTLRGQRFLNDLLEYFIP